MSSPEEAVPRWIPSATKDTRQTIREKLVIVAGNKENVSILEGGRKMVSQYSFCLTGVGSRRTQMALDINKTYNTSKSYTRIQKKTKITNQSLLYAGRTP